MADEPSRLICFSVHEERYAVGASCVHSIVRPGYVTRVPGVERAVIGVTNVRSNVVPVLSLRRVFGMPDVSTDRYTRVIIIERHGRLQGLLVDDVLDIIDESEAESIPAVPVPAAVDASFIGPFFRAGRDLYVTLAVDTLLHTFLDGVSGGKAAAIGS